MKLYTYYRSTSSYRVRIALALKGLDYQSLPVNLVRDGGEHRQPAYLALNPQGRVPALQVDEGELLIQSPAIIEYLAHNMGKSLEEIMNLLNKESGVYGLSGISSDFRDLEKAAEEGNERAQLAQDVFGYRVAKYIGAYTAAMNGVDAIVFTAGLGENNNIMREYICSYLGYLGVKIDQKENAIRSEEKVVSTADSKVKVMVVPTNEELAIARETVELIG